MNDRLGKATKALFIVVLMAADSALTWRLAERNALRAGSAPAYHEVARDPMDQFRLEREQLRARQEAQLNDILHSAETDEKTSGQASLQLMDMLSRAESEQALEGMLQSRGFDEVIVSIGKNAASVLVRAKALTQRESAMILDAVMRETGLTGGNVKIIPVK